MAGLMTPSLGSFVTVEPGRRQPDLAGAYTSGFGEGFKEELRRSYLEAGRQQEVNRRRTQELAAPKTGIESQLTAAGLRMGKDYLPTTDIPSVGSTGRIGLGGYDDTPPAQVTIGTGVDPVDQYFSNIAGYESFVPSAYADAGRQSWGYGTKAGQGTITEAQAAEEAKAHIRGILPQIQKAIPAFDTLPQTVRTAIVNGWYRGDMGGSPKTIELINQGRWEEAAQEYLNHEEYRRAKAAGSGVAARMEANAAAIRSMATAGGIAGGASDTELMGGEGADTPSSAFSAAGEPSPALVQRRMEQAGETESEAAAWLRNEYARRKANTEAFRRVRGLPPTPAPGIPADSPYRVGVATPGDFQVGIGTELSGPSVPVPQPPQEAQFDFSRRGQALAEREAYLRRAMQMAGIQAYLTGDPSQLNQVQAEYAQLGNERALVTGIESLQAASMGNITPLRQFLADQYGTGDVQIYQNTDGTLDIEVDGRSLGRTTLGAIRQQLLADLDPATQQATAAATKYQQELFLKLAPEMLKQQYARNELKNLKFTDLGRDRAFFTYIRDNESFMRPLVEVTVGDQTVYKLGEEQPFSRVR